MVKNVKRDKRQIKCAVSVRSKQTLAWPSGRRKRQKQKKHGVVTAYRLPATDLPSVRHRDHPHAVEREGVLDDGLLLFPGDVRPVEEALMEAGHLDPAALVVVDGCLRGKKGVGERG